MDQRVRFERVHIERFRNLSSLDFIPAPRLNVISGDNGQGKTSLIEALYVLATTRSFRTERLSEVVQQGTTGAAIFARIQSRGHGREQRAQIGQSGRQRQWRVDGKKPERLTDYALKTPIIVFHPGDLQLVSAGAERRRTLLDRLVLYLRPAAADARHRYRRAMRGRLKTLQERGPLAVELAALEAVMAEHGARLATARRAACEALQEQLVRCFSAMAPTTLELRAVLSPGGPITTAELAAEFEQRRVQDRRRGSTSIGPHRDDLVLELDGRSARQHGSQGQQRIVALALKMAELACVQGATGLEPVLLMDDVSSELDSERTHAVFDFLGRSRSQIFVTTTRPELFDPAHFGSEDRGNFRLREGSLDIHS